MLNISRSTVHSGFSVSTGGSHYVSPHSPLGMSVDNTRYIPPVPPTYVTDYQANYKWYPPECYGASPRRHSPISSGRYLSGHNGRTEEPPRVSPRVDEKWNHVLSSVNKLLDQKYEENLLKLVRDQVQARKLDAGLEFAYKHCQDVLSSTDDHAAANGAPAATNGRHDGHPRACVSQLPEDIRNLCKDFVKAVDELKRT